MNRRWSVAVLLVFAIAAAACGSRGDDGDSAGADDDTPASEPTDTTAEPTDTTADDGGSDTTAAPTTDTAAAGGVDCSGPLEATEIGVTADTIKVIVMADSDSPLAPGLFQGAADGAIAWGEKVNANGGLACRQVEVEFWDSKLNATETVNGFLRACESAVALVGTTVLFGNDTTDLNSCPDQAGNPTGVPDVAYITTEPPHQCSTTSYHLSRPGASCPYDSGERDHVVSGGAVQWAVENGVGGPASGAFLVPNDLPSTIGASVPQIEGHQQLTDITYDFNFGISGRATQSEFAQYMQPLRDSGANFVYNGSNDQTMLKFRQEAEAQGLDTDAITWVCSLSCYTPGFLSEGGDAVEGTYVWTFFLPFDEADTNDELATFMDAIGTDFPEAWAAGAWGDGVLFEQVVTAIAERDGPNALTRQAILDELATVTDFDVNGWWGAANFETTLDISPCFMVLQVQGGEFVRVHPEERGTLDCESGNTVQVTVNPDTFVLD
ncbi:MAG: ABC transporter substrate-binding protein [Acidimicrobiia bacterium]|nr:ABC transporter substrate-binding protein [Acidimicrobiia bacterium]